MHCNCLSDFNIRHIHGGFVKLYLLLSVHYYNWPLTANQLTAFFNMQTHVLNVLLLRVDLKQQAYNNNKFKMNTYVNLKCKIYNKIGSIVSSRFFFSQNSPLTSFSLKWLYVLLNFRLVTAINLGENQHCYTNTVIYWSIIN